MTGVETMGLSGLLEILDEQKLSGTEKNILMLMNLTSDDRNASRLTLAEMARRLAVSRKTVTSAIDSLVVRGFLRRVSEHGTPVWYPFPHAQEPPSLAAESHKNSETNLPLAIQEFMVLQEDLAEKIESLMVLLDEARRKGDKNREREITARIDTRIELDYRMTKYRDKLAEKSDDVVKANIRRAARAKKRLSKTSEEATEA